MSARPNPTALNIQHLESSNDVVAQITGITGALSSLQEAGAALDSQARRALVDNARDEAERLNRLVGNLLDMTRLEAGAMQVKRGLARLTRRLFWIGLE